MTSLNQYRRRTLRVSLLVTAWLALSTLSLALPPIGRTMTPAKQGTLSSVLEVGGASGRNDARDTDFFPAIAYDLTTNRYLVTWLTPRNATSQSDGVDVFGRFLDGTGNPSGQEFRISDSNSAARGGTPAVTSGNGEFIVAWAARGTTCRVVAQRVVDQTAQTDRVIVSGVTNMHSPSIIYNSGRKRYVIAFVSGDDYLAPSLSGANTSDCGNNPTSTSSVQAVEVNFSTTAATSGTPSLVSTARKGAFRPRVAYNSDLQRYLVAWEDRQGATAATPYRFDVYAQTLDLTLASVGTNTALATAGDYTNADTTATWTPRPVVVSGKNQFMVAWYSRAVQGSSLTWSVLGRSISGSVGTVGNPLTIFSVPYIGDYTGRAPTGFLSGAYTAMIDEYVFGISAHIDSVFGYLSTALLQRVSSNGQLLKLDGTAQDTASTGWSLDYAIDDRIGSGVAVTSARANGTLDYTFVYSKHPSNATSQDFNVWTGRLQISGVSGFRVSLPMVRR